MKIRKATAEDAASILGLIRELAIYEKAEHEVRCSLAEIQQSLFAADARASALVVEAEQAIVAYAVYFYNYSTWLGKPGIYLEDLYVQPAYRKQGIARSLLKRIANIALEENCGRFEWAVLDWNTPAISFYESLGAKAQDEWTIYRLSGDSLRDFACSDK
jgi:GNAT superfamily N-acetyltransferase